MSFTQVPSREPRPNRSQLAVPGSSARFIEKARAVPADVIMFDLEDAVAPDEKEQARRNVIAAINDLDWGGRTISVRINGLDTPYMYRDVIEVAEQAGEKLDLMLIPKVGVAADVYVVDALLTQIEQAFGRRRRVGIDALIESALGMCNVASIAAASPRLEALHFGPGDYAASTGARTMTIGGPHAGYHVLTDGEGGRPRERHWNDMYHLPIATLVVAARANGLRAVDGPYADFRDVDGFRSAASRSAVLGCEGKWVIHPDQVALANEIYSISDAEFDKARRILAAMAEAQAQGKASVSLEGRMIDVASIRQAETIVRKREAIDRRARA